MYSEAFTTHFKGHMRRAGFTQEALAEKLNVHKSTVSKWIRMKIQISVDDLQICCTLFKLTKRQEIDLFYLAGLIPVCVKTNTLTFYPDQRTANEAITSNLNSGANLPQKAQIVQYSSDSVFELITTLVTKQIEVELFLQHPDTATGEDKDKEQPSKICDNVIDYIDRGELRNAIKAGKLTIFLYRDIATVRAIRLDNEIYIGNYTYETSDLGVNKVHGHDNYLIHFPSYHPDYLKVIAQFQRTLDALGQRKQSLIEVFAQCGGDLHRLTQIL